MSRDRPAGVHARPDDGDAAARACPGAARLSPDSGRRPAGADAPPDPRAARPRHAGAHLHTVCTHIHNHEGGAGVRRILGVLALAKKYGAAAADDAAKAALDLQVPTYRFLRRYLERRPPAPLTLKQVDPLIRQFALYRDLIDRQTGDLVLISSNSITRSANCGCRVWPMSWRSASARRNHAHVLKCGPRSWRTKVHTDLRTEAPTK